MVHLVATDGRCHAGIVVSEPETEGVAGAIASRDISVFGPRGDDYMNFGTPYAKLTTGDRQSGTWHWQQEHYFLNAPAEAVQGPTDTKETADGRTEPESTD